MHHFCGSSSVGRASASQAEGREFEPHLPLTMNESILNGVLLFSTLQALLFSLVSFSKKNRILPDLLIGVWLFLIATHSFLVFCVYNNLISGISTLLPIIITLLYGPLYYLYIYKICSGSLKIKNYELFNFIPFLIFFISLFIFRDSVYFSKILAASSSILGLSYCFISLYTLRRHLVNVRNQFSFTEKVNLSWLNKLVFGLIILWFGVVILVFLKRIFNYEFSLYWFYTSIPLFIFYIGYNGIKQQNIYSFHISIPEKTGYKNSGLRENQKQEIYEKLLNAMVSNKLFTNPTLSLQNLSDMLSIPPHHITQTLNEFVKQNFYDFVNSYRVNEFKKRVDQGDSERFSLLGIALDCGFNSKSSFNRIFKNTTGFTPSEYRLIQI